MFAFWIVAAQWVQTTTHWKPVLDLRARLEGCMLKKISLMLLKKRQRNDNPQVDGEQANDALSSKASIA